MKLWALLVAVFGVILFWLKTIFFHKEIDKIDSKVIDLTNTINVQSQELVKKTEETNNAVQDYEALKRAYDKSKSNNGSGGSSDV